MNSTKLWLAVFVISIAVCFLVGAAEQKFTLPPETTKLKPGPGSELVTAQCLLCHSADYIATQPRLTRTVWKAEVTKMQQKYGAPISTNSVNADALVEYLTKNYGKENPTNSPEK
ncbi:MAG: putative sulfite:cytochrome c oxidoreductase (Subunit b) protein [Pedosphaera sp.]|nr:putative sulfite:cytochrome c oxidoreductase (Subunit b) protein [Pedosphaera sp.]